MSPLSDLALAGAGVYADDIAIVDEEGDVDGAATQGCPYGLRPAYRLPELVAVVFPPVVEDGDVGAYGEVADAHVQELFGLVHALNLGAGWDAHADGGLEDFVAGGEL